MHQGGFLQDLADPAFTEAKKYKDSSDEEIADANISSRAKDIITSYHTFKYNNYRDPSFETTWTNVKLNPSLITDNPDLKFYLIQRASLYEVFWRWAKQKGNYFLEDEINNYFKSKFGTGIHDDEITFLKDQLANGSASNYNYTTVQSIRKRLAYLEKANS